MLSGSRLFAWLALLGLVLLAACSAGGPATVASPSPMAAAPQPAAAQPTAPPQPTEAPAQPETRTLSFAEGADEAALQGSLAAQGIVHVVVPGQEGETWHVTLTTEPADGAILAIWGADGTVLLSDHATASQWEGTLPSTQDYTIAIMAGPQDVTYTLTVTRQGPVQVLSLENGMAEAKGQLAAQAAQDFRVTLPEGKTVRVKVTTEPADGAILVIWGADGTVLLSDHATASQWEGPIPSTQDYTIRVLAGPQDVTYTLTVDVVEAQGGAQAERVSFAPGATSATVHGELGPNEGRDYVLTLLEKQRVRVQVTTEPADGAILVIWGADGTVLLSDHATASQWEGTIPSTQDYTIRVLAGPQAIRYTLTVEAEPLIGGITPPTPEPQRITFGQGGTEATVEGSLEARGQALYVIRAAQGQTMTVRVDAPQTDGQSAVILSIWAEDGTVLLSDHAGAAQWQGELPATGDYFIQLMNITDQTVSYRMTVTIPPK